MATNTAHCCCRAACSAFRDWLGRDRLHVWQRAGDEGWSTLDLCSTIALTE